MKSEVTSKRVMALKTAQIKVNPDDGSLSHLLSIECVLEPGDLERIAIMFKQRLPIDLTLTSPQSRMDLLVEVRREEEPQHVGPLDAVTLEELRENAKVAVRTAANAEHLAETGDDNDREVANASEDVAANAITKAAEAAGMSEVEMSVSLKAEIELETEDEFAAALRKGADPAFKDQVYERPIFVDETTTSEQLHRQIADHAAESEAAAEGDGTGGKVPEKPKRQRKARQTA